ncbi:17658_t:CDS:2, partial [Racocetra fulgida]
CLYFDVLDLIESDMNLPSSDNTSTLPSESTRHPPDETTVGDNNERQVVDNSNNDATSIPGASIITVGPDVNNKKEDEKFYGSKHALNKVGSNLKSFVGFIGPGYTEVIGSAIAMNLLFNLPLPAGYLPSSEIFTNSEQLYIAIGIIGATVMPHNLYLHSHLVKVRKNREESRGFDEKIDETPKKIKVKSIVDRTLRLSTIDSSVALAILIVSAANFFYGDPNRSQTKPADLFDAYDLLTSYLGKAAATLFAIGLLIAGQSATLTATMAGQVVMEGFVEWKLRPWVRRLITRGFAVVPAMLIAIILGRSGLNDLLVASQVALSIQLPFAVIPMVYFTSSKRFMQVNIRVLEERVMADKLNHQVGSLSHDLNSIVSAIPLTPNSPYTPTQIVSVANENNVSQSPDDDILDFSNPILLIIISVIISIVILGLDLFLVYTTIKDAIVG